MLSALAGFTVELCMVLNGRLPDDRTSPTIPVVHARKYLICLLKMLAHNMGGIRNAPALITDSAEKKI